MASIFCDLSTNILVWCQHRDISCLHLPNSLESLRQTMLLCLALALCSIADSVDETMDNPAKDSDQSQSSGPAKRGRERLEVWHPFQLLGWGWGMTGPQRVQRATGRGLYRR